MWALRRGLFVYAGLTQGGGEQVTTSFNFVGAVHEGGVLRGNFSGCEISKTAGSAAGTFEARAVVAEGGSGD